MSVIIASASSSVDEIVAQLTEAVHEHRLQPGTKLREDEVCEIFGVSRTLVDRKSVVLGKSVDFGGRRLIKKKK